MRLQSQGYSPCSPPSSLYRGGDESCSLDPSVSDLNFLPYRIRYRYGCSVFFSLLSPFFMSLSFSFLYPSTSFSPSHTLPDHTATTEHYVETFAGVRMREGISSSPTVWTITCICSQETLTSHTQHTSWFIFSLCDRVVSRLRILAFWTLLTTR